MNETLMVFINVLFIILRQPVAMDPTQIGLFNLAEKRLTWSAQRQSVLATNIANANTPGFKARDVASFDTLLARTAPIMPTQTQAGHMAGTLPTNLAPVTEDGGETSGLDGNSVTLDRQLMKVADTETSQSLVTTIWKKYVGMFGIALGRSG
jgi:flagellar basal-body rod protein FlgB